MVTPGNLKVHPPRLVFMVQVHDDLYPYPGTLPDVPMRGDVIHLDYLDPDQLSDQPADKIKLSLEVDHREYGSPLWGQQDIILVCNADDEAYARFKRFGELGIAGDQIEAAVVDMLTDTTSLASPPVESDTDASTTIINKVSFSPDTTPIDEVLGNLQTLVGQFIGDRIPEDNHAWSHYRAQLESIGREYAQVAFSDIANAQTMAQQNYSPKVKGLVKNVFGWLAGHDIKLDIVSETAKTAKTEAS